MMNKAHFNTITILVDNDSWILPYAQELTDYFSACYDCQLVRSANDIKLGDVCFLLGCTKIVSKDILTLNQYNLIVHESALPKGKGFAPVTWQIIDGEKSIPVCLIEASDNVDSGQVWLKDTIELNGNELHDEWRDKQGRVTIKLAKDFIEHFMRLNAEEQNGQASFYARRSIKDSELNIDKSLAEQFNLLRVVSNSDYPAFFIKDGVKYKLEISRHD